MERGENLDKVSEIYHGSNFLSSVWLSEWHEKYRYEDEVISACDEVCSSGGRWRRRADIRNTKVVDIYHTLNEYTSNVTVCGPYADAGKVKSIYGYLLKKRSSK